MTPTRKALLIMSPDEGKNFLASVATDKTNWTQYLQSAAGGGWRANEITVLGNPSASLVMSHVRLMQKVDYAFIAFSGHGDVTGDEDTRLHVSPNSTMKARELLTDIKRQTLVLDCCREKVAETLVEARVFKASAESFIDVSRARALFDMGIMDAGEYQAILYSCSVGQRAGDNEAVGGFYTGALIRAGQGTQKGDVMRIREAHATARIAVTRRRSTQTPVADLPRSNPTFPFAIG